MKKLTLHIVCVVACVLFSLGVEAQTQPSPECSGTVRIFNQSTEAWTIKYYNSTVTVQPSTSFNLGLTNADPTASRAIYLASDASCIHFFPPNDDNWSAPCAPGTFAVIYYATRPLQNCQIEAFENFTNELTNC